MTALSSSSSLSFFGPRRCPYGRARIETKGAFETFLEKSNRGEQTSAQSYPSKRPEDNPTSKNGFSSCAKSTNANERTQMPPCVRISLFFVLFFLVACISITPWCCLVSLSSPPFSSASSLQTEHTTKTFKRLSAIVLAFALSAILIRSFSS